MGAWIETSIRSRETFGKYVAPYVGAWIETVPGLLPVGLVKSHPTWVRGLKHHLPSAINTALGRTLRGCVD